MGHGNWATDPNYAGKVIGIFHADGRVRRQLARPYSSGSITRCPSSSTCPSKPMRDSSSTRNHG